MPFRYACAWSSSVMHLYFLPLQRNPIWEQHHHNEPVCLMFVASMRPRILYLTSLWSYKIFLWILVLGHGVYTFVCVHVFEVYIVNEVVLGWGSETDFQSMAQIFSSLQGQKCTSLIISFWNPLVISFLFHGLWWLYWAYFGLQFGA